MKVYEIVSEMANRRAIIKGEYCDLSIGAVVVVKDRRERLYEAEVVTRGNYGYCIVDVKDVI